MPKLSIMPKFDESKGKFDSDAINALERLSHLLTWPWLYSVSGLVSAFHDVPHLRHAPWKAKLKRWAWGILYVTGVLNLFPMFFWGQIVWVLIHTFVAPKRDFVVKVVNGKDSEDDAPNMEKDEYTFVTANLLLGLDGIGKFQNAKDVSLALIE